MIGLNYCINCPVCVKNTDINNMKSLYDSDYDLCDFCKNKLIYNIQKKLNDKYKLH
jgi:hypothetical protein